MHLCVGQRLVSTLITMSIPMPYAVAVTNPSVTCRSIFDKYSPRMVIHGQLMRHRRQVTLQYYCWQKVGIWHSKSVVSFIWVMALFTGRGEDYWCPFSVMMMSQCHIPWSQLPSLSSAVITSPWSGKATHDPVSVKWKLSPMMGTRLWSVMMVIMLITRMIGMHISLGNSSPSPELRWRGRVQHIISKFLSNSMTCLLMLPLSLMLLFSM